VDLHDIRYFVVSAKVRNLTWAAKQCGVTQSTMTRSLQKLEAELGGLLLVRNPGRLLLDLTPLAEIVLAEMQKICSTLDNIHDIAKTSARSSEPQPSRMSISEPTDSAPEEPASGPARA
jgi:LysR family hydrogen peroxide-inducible transcriptional activator